MPNAQAGQDEAELTDLSDPPPGLDPAVYLRDATPRARRATRWRRRRTRRSDR